MRGSGHRSFLAFTLSFIRPTSTVLKQQIMIEHSLWFSPCWLLRRGQGLQHLLVSPGTLTSSHKNLLTPALNIQVPRVIILCAHCALPENPLPHVLILGNSCSTFQAQPHGPSQVQPTPRPSGTAGLQRPSEPLLVLTSPRPRLCTAVCVEELPPRACYS